jgi:hypothetical protein
MAGSMPISSTRALILAASALLLIPAPGAAQSTAASAGTCRESGRLVASDLSTIDRDIGRALQLAGALQPTPAFFRRASSEMARGVCIDNADRMRWAVESARPDDGRVHVGLAPVSLEMESNSQYRRDRNNGAFRGGVGASTSVSAGVTAEWRWLSLQVAPRVIRDANDEFEIMPVDAAGVSPYVNPFHIYVLDFPQRFGTDTETRFDPGQSYVRLGTRHFESGVSTENIWLGASQVHPIMLSATAPGFPHAFAGTAEPIDIWIGKIGAQAVWARVDESAFFDQQPDNDHRLFAATVIEFSPRWIPGLHLGIARVYHETIPPEGLPLGYWVGSIIDTGITWGTGGNRADGNGIGALLARWVLPEAGFEAWGEWSREDTPHDVWDLIEEPDWTQAYAFGFQQLATFRHARLRWYGELIHLGEAAPVRAGKGHFSYYTHGAAQGGHTHDGQILGSAAGPGSDAQIVGMDAFHQYGMTGLWLERTRYDEDTYYRRYARLYGESRHDVEIGAGVRHMMRIGPLQASGELLFNRRANRSFLHMEDHSQVKLVERNLGLRLRAVWRP